MSELFNKRMALVLENGSLGAHLIEDSNLIEAKTFSNDQNYQKGWIYDWSMEPLEEVEFKFEKIKTHKAEKAEVEYMIHFLPNYNPEFIFKDKHYKDDGRERLGFYIDVYDRSKNSTDKWLIIGKDDRVAFDRYNAYKCNWIFEWIYQNQYYKCLGCVRDATDNSFNKNTNDKLGGTTVDGEISIILPTNQITQTILLGTRFIVSDNQLNPQTYEVIKIKDVNPLGVTSYFCKQIVFNPHKDFYGKVNESQNIKFCFDLPLEDLDTEFGGNIHMLCDCIVEQDKPVVDMNEVYLECSEKYLYINGHSVLIRFHKPIEYNIATLWRYCLDDSSYRMSELSDYFEINETDESISIRAINKDLAKYHLEVEITDGDGNIIDSIGLEVRL